MNRSSSRRSRSLVMTAVLTLATLAGCSSGSDSESSAGATDSTAEVSANSAPVDDQAADSRPVDDQVADTEVDDGTDDSDSSPSDAECGGLTGAEIGAAAGVGTFDVASDISVDTDSTCLFRNSIDIYGVTVSTETTEDYLMGDLVGESLDDALTFLGSFHESAFDGPTVKRVTAGGVDAVVVSGPSMIGGDNSATIASVVDGVVVTVDADGSALAADPAGFEPIVTAIFVLATSGT